GGSYVLHAKLEGKSVTVEYSSGKTLHVASVEEARKRLSSVSDVKLFMIHAVAHDEMDGLDDVQAQTSRHEIPLRSSL
ncbi:cation transporter, partial [Pseudomonas syringae]